MKVYYLEYEFLGEKITKQFQNLFTFCQSLEEASDNENIIYTTINFWTKEY